MAIDVTSNDVAAEECSEASLSFWWSFRRESGLAVFARVLAYPGSVSVRVLQRERDISAKACLPLDLRGNRQAASVDAFAAAAEVVQAIVDLQGVEIGVGESDVAVNLITLRRKLIQRPGNVSANIHRREQQAHVVGWSRGKPVQVSADCFLVWCDSLLLIGRSFQFHYHPIPFVGFAAERNHSRALRFTREDTQLFS